MVIRIDHLIETNTQTRVQCALEEELKRGTLVNYEPSKKYLNTESVVIAVVADVTK